MTPQQPPTGMMEWMPIDSAPKDGVALVYCPGAIERKRIVTAQFRDGKPFIVNGVFAFDCPPVTHWMPLPPEPGK